MLQNGYVRAEFNKDGLLQAITTIDDRRKEKVNLVSTVTIQVPDIWIPESLNIRMFWSFGFQIQVVKKLFYHWKTGQIIRFSNTIWILNNARIEQLLTILILDMSVIQIPTAIVFITSLVQLTWFMSLNCIHHLLPIQDRERRRKKQKQIEWRI